MALCRLARIELRIVAGQSTDGKAPPACLGDSAGNSSAAPSDCGARRRGPSSAAAQWSWEPRVGWSLMPGKPCDHPYAPGYIPKSRPSHGASEARAALNSRVWPQRPSSHDDWAGSADASTASVAKAHGPRRLHHRPLAESAAVFVCVPRPEQI